MPASAQLLTVRYRSSTVNVWEPARALPSSAAAAEAMGCDTVDSENLNSGHVYGGIRLIDPFSSRG